MSNSMSHMWKIYLLTMMSFFVGTSQFIIVGVLDKIAVSLGVSLSTAGQLVTIFALANALGTPAVIVATAKLDLRKQLLLALAIILMGTALTILSPGFTLLMISRAIIGVGTGVFIVTAYAMAAKLASAGNQGKAMSNISMGFSASLVFGVPLGRVIANAYNWHAVFWLIGFFSIMGTFVIAKLIPTTKHDAPVPLRDQIAFLKRPDIVLMLLVSFFVFIGYSMVNTYITPLIKNSIPLGELHMSAILLALGVASLIGSKSGGFWADHLGIMRTLFWCLFIKMLVLMLLPFADVSMFSFGLLLVWSVVIWAFAPAQNFNLVSRAPTAASVMLSLNSTFIQVGFALGAGLGGLIIGRYPVVMICWPSALAVALAIGLIILGKRSSKL